jgi:8-oxo-dGTP pyrophosphatase MutT (NUDIX family)
MSTVESAGDRLTALSDEIRAMAANGLHYGTDPYDRARYDRLIRIAAELLALADTRSADDIERAYRGALGMLTPMVGASAVIFDEGGRLLLTQRADNGTWCLPGGAADIGESPSQVAVRETLEETGLCVKATALIGLYDSQRLPGPTRAWQGYQLAFACEIVGGALTTTHETTDFAWCSESEAMALPMTASQRAKLPDAFAWRREPNRVVFH